MWHMDTDKRMGDTGGYAEGEMSNLQGRVIYYTTTMFSLVLLSYFIYFFLFLLSFSHSHTLRFFTLLHYPSHATSISTQGRKNKERH